ncbi:biotin/lipoyl attachment domain-containing protein [Luminiphilus syltensis NOR5-1B]|uniref:Biotin/lipoyl attachment domain-containing protein n=1 Tax=Luminiphilus syltensis NOR5-1B TaxID=565045 RepID=B8KRM9_9GAMM|nr:biotin/lipoyl-containing protein [Luminiphilus syltensis]EED36308.1 biotin/lipoyl attachment domain-containing protein [Luminiphilus syltensis NOR5-1B]
MSNEHYLNNPMIHRERRLSQATSPWVRQFDCSHMRPLIICRGPIRKEAMDVFAEMGITHYGILLSEKDSIVYPRALAPELRVLTDPYRVHRVPDYTGATKEERDQRIADIIAIARDGDYNSIFAGYGFMAEDETMVAAMEAAGLNFIGPCSRTVRQAGLKDEAKRTALKTGVSVTPGIDNGTALTLLKKYPTVSDLQTLCKKEGLEVDASVWEIDAVETIADEVLAASYRKGIDLYTVEELSETLTECVEKINEQYPENRVRLKAIGGGGGKGQRIIALGDAARTPELVREILNEVKTTGVGDNKNVLVELNIETTRHQEIQVVGNGEWSITLGGRDCSLQMHEQKLLEVSVTRESLLSAQQRAEQDGRAEEAAVMAQDVRTLDAMEDEASRFGTAVGLDSVSTFECIVDRDKHFFMEMNTRIQVEHRVSELCYAMKFTNPDNDGDSFVVESLVEAMVLLAAHGPALPKPERIPRFEDSVEARLNATNDALQPNAGGQIEYWSDAIDGEIRDDQGISLHNPDTDVFMNYTLAGAYDSNIALLLTVGDSREQTYERMAEVLRATSMRGRDLHTNLAFHYGLVHWFLGRTVNARPTTKFIVPYLTSVGELATESRRIDVDTAWSLLVQSSAAELDAAEGAQLTEALSRKQSLLLRPLRFLLDSPHALSGWLSLNQKAFDHSGDTIVWAENPIEVLADTYHFLKLNYSESAPAANVIWEHDHAILTAAEDFYSDLGEYLPTGDWSALNAALAGEAPEGFNAEEWLSVQSAHRGFQAGMEILELLPAMAQFTGFFELAINSDMTIHFPERLLDEEHQKAMMKALAPPPLAKSDEIVAASGGMFYGRESPDAPVYLEVGSHFEAGDPLYIVEVMKMFNKVYAPFSGTVDEVLVEGDGTIISKGQTLFKVTPDEQIEIETDDVVASRKREHTRELMKLVL